MSDDDIRICPDDHTCPHKGEMPHDCKVCKRLNMYDFDTAEEVVAEIDKLTATVH